jgi:hypothetical protein
MLLLMWQLKAFAVSQHVYAHVHNSHPSCTVYGINPYLFESEMANRGATFFCPNPEGDAAVSMAAYAALVNPSKTVGDGADIARFLLELIENKHGQYSSGANIAVEGKGKHWPASEVPARFAAAMAAESAATAE